MDKYRLAKGEGRTKVSLSACHMGSDFIVCIFNKNAHIGALTLAEYDDKTQRVSTSVITRLGHKDDAVAQRAAYSIGKNTKRPVCVIAGIHIHNITKGEIEQVLENTDSLIDEFLSLIK